MSNYPVGTRVRAVIEGVVTEDDDELFYVGAPTAGVPSLALRSKNVVSVEILEPPKPEWVQGDVVVINPGRDFSFVLVHQADRWVCSKENARNPHDHTDDDVNRYLDNGQATVLIAGGKVVTPE